MRIGIDVRVADPVESGQQRYLWRLGTWLGARGHDVHFISVRPRERAFDPASAPALPPGTTLHDHARKSPAQHRAAVGALDLDVLLLNPERSRRYRGLRANVLRAAYGTDQYRQKLRSFRTGPVRLLRRIARIAPWTLAERGWERGFYEARPAPYVVAQSEYMRRQILTDYGVPAGHVRVVPNGVDTTEFASANRQSLRTSARDRFEVDDADVCLLVLAHNFRLKGIDVALRALARQRSGVGIHLLIAGKGTGAGQRRAFRRLARRHLPDRGPELRVTFTGPISPAVEALAAADALLHLSWHDSFGFAVLEAMACGLPVVTTPYAGASELIVHGKSGLVVDPASAAEVDRAMLQLLDRAERERLGHAASIVGAEHAESKSFERVLRVMELAAQDRVGTG